MTAAPQQSAQDKAPAKDQKTSDTKKVIYAAIVANLGIATAKFIVAAITGSAAMMAEGIHSAVDTGNEVLLLVGEKNALKPPDAKHPFGYGKVVYFWALIVALSVFSLGGGLSIYNGVHGLLNPEPVEDPMWSYAVLGVAALFEGYSWNLSRLGLNKFRKDGDNLWQAVRASKDASVFTVFIEDSAALIGVVVAALGIGLGQLFDNPLFDPAASVVIGLLLVALFAPWIAPADPIATSWGAIRKAPDAAHWFGTDEIGRDVFARVVWGTRASLLAGVVSVSISLLLGVPIGLAAGFLGGWVDGVISRITDAFLACPFLILAIALAAFLGPSLSNAMIAIGVSAAPIFVRLTRAQVQGITVEDYIEAARAVGNPPLRIALRHVLPNITAPLIVQATLAIAAAVIAEASLSFLGLGQQPPAPSWGSMLNTAKNFIDNAPWMAVWPGGAIFLLVLSFNLLGDGLRDALDPRQR